MVPMRGTAKRDLGMFVTAIKQANLTASQLERWPALAGGQHSATGREPLQPGAHTARTGTSQVPPAPPAATMVEAACIADRLGRIVRVPGLLAPSYAACWPEAGMGALQPVSEALTAAAGLCAAASGRLIHAFLRVCGPVRSCG
jgi:hypothetical protein